MHIIHTAILAAYTPIHVHTQDLLSLEPECRFEEKFFQFRSTIKSLEHRLSSVLQQTFDQCPTLEAELRVLEMFQGVSKREAVQVSSIICMICSGVWLIAICGDSGLCSVIRIVYLLYTKGLDSHFITE